MSDEEEIEEEEDNYDFEAQQFDDDDFVEDVAEDANMIPEHLRGENFDEDMEEHLDKLEEILAKAKPAVNPNADPRQYTEALFGLEQLEENLGENFEETRWLPPTVEKAMEFRSANLFRKGLAVLRSVNITTAADAGANLPLYFQFVKSMSIAFLFMTLFSLPALVLAYYGTRIPLSDRDALGLYQFSIGNIGYDENSITYRNDSACSFIANTTATNATCIHVLGQEFTVENTNSVLGIMEFLQVVAFLLAVLSFHSKTQHFREKTEGEVCTISSYSILVTGIPEDTEVEHLISHFSSLYALDKPDWKHRPPVAHAEPVQHCDNTMNPVHVGTWIAECTLHRKIGVFIKAFQKKQHLMEKLYKYRAQMKMYADNTCLTQGGNKRLYKIAEENMISVGADLDLFSESLVKKVGLKINKTHSSGKIFPTIDEADVELGKLGSASDMSGNSNRESVAADQAISADAVAAFIAFEHTESFARCIEDYAKYSKFPFSLFYPKELKFRGHRIKVRKAPEPDEIVWENLEVSKGRKIFYRARTNFVTFLLVLACFVIILQAAIYKQQFSDALPQQDICGVEIPALYFDSYEDVSQYSSSELLRPEGNITESLELLDAECDSVLKGSFYAKYTWDGDYTDPVYTYSIDACFDSDGSLNICPVPSTTEPHCPCVIPVPNGEHTRECETLQCYKDAIVGFNDDHVTGQTCSTFDASVIGGCYCQQVLLDLLSGGVWGSVNKVRSAAAGSDAVCSAFLLNYSLASGLTYMAIVVSVVINYFLGVALKYLTTTECHLSLDSEQGSLLFKIFGAIYFNIALVVLIAFGRINDMPSEIQIAQLFTGTYEDFTLSWYGAVGSLFVGSLFVQSFTPLLKPLWDYHITKPYIRSFHYAKVDSQSSTKFPMQHDLNMVEVGPVFSPTIQAANLLAVLFFGMTYATGLPIMNLILFIVFTVFFFTDRKLLCKYYQRPPRIGDAVFKVVCKCLPYAALIRLGVGIWMLTTPEVFTTTPNTLIDVSVPIGQSVMERINVTSVLPLIVLFLLVVVIKLLRVFWKQLPFYWMAKGFKLIFSRCLNEQAARVYTDEHGFIQLAEIHASHDPLRKETSPYTGPYYKILQNKADIGKSKGMTKIKEVELSFADLEQEWFTCDYPLDPDNYIVKAMEWKKLVHVAGVVRKQGEFKRTYEVINALGGLSSYALDRVPAYKMTMNGLKEGTSSLMERQAEQRAGAQQAATITDLIKVMQQADSVVSGFQKKRTKRIKKEKEARYACLYISDVVSLYVCLKYANFYCLVIGTTT